MKKITLVIVSFGFMAILSGCSTSSVSRVGKIDKASFLRTTDGGSKWEPKMKVDDKKSIASVDVLSLAVNPVDSNKVYIGTVGSGIFVTKDGAETWTNLAFPENVYALLLDPQNPQRIYATGVLEKRGKIFKRENEESDWDEIYTEPAEGTFISSLGIDKANPQVLYAGTSGGVIIKSTDGGQQWVNLKMPSVSMSGVIGGIAFDAADSSTVYFTVFQKGIVRTKDAGTTLENMTEKIATAGIKGKFFSILADPVAPGVIYAGTDGGIFKGTGGGEKWEALNIIASSKEFPIRAMAVNPRNTQEIIYSSAKAIYKSTDGGVRWSTFQLDTPKSINVMKYDPNDPTRIYAGLRKM